MHYYLETRDGRRLEVEVVELGDGLFDVRHAGRSYRADFADVNRSGQYALKLGARAFAVSIEPADAGELVVRIAGESFHWKAQDERERAARSVAARKSAGVETVRAPMPGVLLDLRVQAGERVEPGTAVAVVEAMKMQNEVAAMHGGVVREVLVQVGQAVAGNQPLVVLVAAADASA